MASKDPIVSPGIILRIFPYSESDLIMRVLTSQKGKISVIARHARTSQKRFASRPDLFDHGSFSFNPGRGDLFQLQNFVPSRPFRSLRSDLLKLSAASVMAECFDTLIKEDAADSEEYFNLFRESLYWIENASTPDGSLEGCRKALFELVSWSGFFIEPAAPSLERLISIVEETTERELKSKAALQCFLPKGER